MNSRPDDRRILTLVNSTKTCSKKRKRQRNSTTCKKSTFLQEIDQELPGVSQSGLHNGFAKFPVKMLKNRFF